MHPALRSMMTETIQHAPYLGRDAYGAPTHGSLTVQPARVQYVSKRFTNAQGQELMSRAIVYVNGTLVVGIQDKVVLDDGTSPKIQRVDTWTDPTTRQSDHRKLYF